MNSTSIGRKAEETVAKHLEKEGYKLVVKNWRNRFCEIDLVMTKGDEVYFIEVKYRSSDRQGSGFEYITPKKLKQMRFAAEYWISVNDWDGDAILLASEVDNRGSVQVLELG